MYSGCSSLYPAWNAVSDRASRMQMRVSLCELEMRNAIWVQMKGIKADTLQRTESRLRKEPFHMHASLVAHKNTFAPFASFA